MTTDLTLVTGGARSGKSRYALSLLEGSASVTFIATAEALDDDMRRRIARHRAERPASWSTVEAPRDLAVALEGVPADAAVVVDCLTLWVSNLLMSAGDAAGSDEPWYPADEVDAAVAALERRPGKTVVVTNEVGLGVVPPTPLGRAYRDALGRVNQRVAAVADGVVLLVAGIPWTIK